MWNKFLQWALEHNHDHQYRLLEDMNLEECMVPGCRKLNDKDTYE